MKKALLLHNPNAGDENHVKSTLITLLEANGYKALYHKVKKDKQWPEKIDQVDFAVVAGGDGSIRRAAKALLKRKLTDKNIPLAILPMGTANNLSKTLGIDSSLPHHHHIKNWQIAESTPFDVGLVRMRDKDPKFFLEAAGFGLFPLLMAAMDNPQVPSLKTAKEELAYALAMLHTLTLEAPAHPYQLKINGALHKGKFISLEVLNTPYVGPNLHLAPNAEVDDGVLDIVCIDESQREAFASYVKNLMEGKASTFLWKSFRATDVRVKTPHKLLHIDDELIQATSAVFNFEIRQQVLRFVL